MSKRPEAVYEPVPPIIFAARVQEPSEVKSWLERLDDSGINKNEVGIKLPQWLSHDKNARNYCFESGRYTVLDLQIGDGPNEMESSVKRHLGMFFLGRYLLPNAITMTPIGDKARKNPERIKEHIIDYSHGFDKPIAVISHSKQTEFAPADDMLHGQELEHLETQANDSESEDRVRAEKILFDICEVHADTLLGSTEFRKDLMKKLFIIASRFSTEDDMTEDTVINRVARTFRVGARSVYLGNSVLSADDPIAHLIRGLQAHSDAESLSKDEFDARYPSPRIMPPAVEPPYNASLDISEAHRLYDNSKN